MKKLINLFVMVMVVSGCATLDPSYYSNVNSPGYVEKVFSGVCEKCNRVFSFSRQQFDTIENVQCCYCGHVQNLEMASNRYEYLQQQQEKEKQRQQALSNQVVVNNLFQLYQQNLKQSAQRQQQYDENIGNAALNWGGLKSTPNYPYIPSPSRTSSQQSVYWTPSGDGAILSSSEGETCIQLLNGGWKCSK